MNGMIVKALAMAGVLIAGTLVVVKQMKIDLSDPINLITMLGAVAIAVLSFGVAAKYMQQIPENLRKKTGTALANIKMNCPPDGPTRLSVR